MKRPLLAWYSCLLVCGYKIEQSKRRRRRRRRWRRWCSMELTEIWIYESWRVPIVEQKTDTWTNSVSPAMVVVVVEYSVTTLYDFERSWQQNFFQNEPNFPVAFGLFGKTVKCQPSLLQPQLWIRTYQFISKNCGFFLGNFLEKLGYFLFQLLVTLDRWHSYFGCCRRCLWTLNWNPSEKFASKFASKKHTPMEFKNASFSDFFHLHIVLWAR